MEVWSALPDSRSFLCHTPPRALSTVLSRATARPLLAHGLTSATRCPPRHPIWAGKVLGTALGRLSHVRREGNLSCSGSKFFVEGLSQGSRLETAGTEVKVTSIQPGNVSTELHELCDDAEALERYAPTERVYWIPKRVTASVVHSLRQPDHVAVNEIPVEPRDEPVCGSLFEDEQGLRSSFGR